LVQSNITVTNMQRIYGPEAADHAFALLLELTRGVRENLVPNAKLTWYDRPDLVELRGKTMLVLGLGGVGTQIARRAQAFGVRVRAVDPKDLQRPAFVFSLDKPARLAELLPQADVLVVACPLTPETRGLVGAAQFASMKKSAYLINVSRGPIVD